MRDRSPRAVELILARTLMAGLTTPALLVDVSATLVFFNDPAAQIFGLRFEEAGPMSAEDWRTRFDPVADDGRRVPVEELPLLVALNQERPVHRPLRIRSAGADLQRIEVTAFPIGGSGGVCGAIAIFWESADPP